jgi:hypothetical protein
VMKFYLSVRNFTYCRRNLSLTENNFAAAAKLIRWLQRIRGIKYIEEEHHAQKNKFIS